MTIVRAKVLGFCMGVRQAVKVACNQLACNQAECPTPPTPHSPLPTPYSPLPTPYSPLPTPPKKVYTLGPLIHNPQALEDLKQRGIEILDENKLPETLSGVVVIIRAHGVSPQTEAELRERGAVVVDATCPKVKASQLKAASLAKEGYRLFLAGDESHAEIAGIRGYAHVGSGEWGVGSGVVVSCAAEAETAAARLAAEDSTPAKTALLAQTTFSTEEYQAIGDAVSRYVSELEIVSTICAATRERQDSLRELLGKTDAVVIAGGKDSANTRRLLAIAQEAGKPCAIVETAADIPPDFFKFETVGLAAGASTPDTVIDAIEQGLNKSTKYN